MVDSLVVETPLTLTITPQSHYLKAVKLVGGYVKQTCFLQLLIFCTFKKISSILRSSGELGFELKVRKSEFRKSFFLILFSKSSRLSDADEEKNDRGTPRLLRARQTLHKRAKATRANKNVKR